MFHYPSAFALLFAAVTWYSSVAGIISDFNGCNVAESVKLGNGQCDADGGYNTEACEWDGGDCCPSTCVSSVFTCGTDGYRNCHNAEELLLSALEMEFGSKQIKSLPSGLPTGEPTGSTLYPTGIPTLVTGIPSFKPTVIPSTVPTGIPSSSVPTGIPSSHPTGLVEFEGSTSFELSFENIAYSAWTDQNTQTVEDAVRSTISPNYKIISITITLLYGSGRRLSASHSLVNGVVLSVKVVLRFIESNTVLSVVSAALDSGLYTAIATVAAKKGDTALVAATLVKIGQVAFLDIVILRMTSAPTMSPVTGSPVVGSPTANATIIEVEEAVCVSCYAIDGPDMEKLSPDMEKLNNSSVAKVPVVRISPPSVGDGCNVIGGCPGNKDDGLVDQDKNPNGMFGSKDKKSNNNANNNKNMHNEHGKNNKGRRMLKLLTPKDVPKPSLPSPTPKGDLGLYLYGVNDTWWRSDGLGTAYEILDKAGKVYYAGTLCPGEPADSSCDVMLRPGHYIFQVGGASDPNKEGISWHFCSSHGGAETSLLFSVGMRGECTPLSWSLMSDESSLSSVVESSQSDFSNAIVFEGSFEITGLESSVLSDIDIMVLQNAISSLLTQTAKFSMDSSVSIVASQRANLASNTVSVKTLNTESETSSVLVTFRVSIMPGDLGLQSVDSDSIAQAVEFLSGSMDAAMENGIFAEYVRAIAEANGVTSLESISTTRFVNVRVISNIGYTTDSDQRSGDFSVSVGLVGMIVIGMGVLTGLLVGVFVGKAKSNKTESESTRHDESESGSEYTSTTVQEISSVKWESEQQLADIPAIVPLQSLHTALNNFSENDSTHNPTVDFHSA